MTLHTNHRSFFGITLLTTVFLLLLSNSCSDRSTLTALDEADRLLDTHPDSSLSILKGIDTRTLGSKKDKARYSVLLFSSLSKNDSIIISDSILRPALDYYAQDNNYSREKMLTHFFYGIYLADINKRAESIKEFDKAIETGEAIKDNLYTGLAFGNNGCTYSWEGLKEEEIEYTSKGLEKIRLTGDTSRLINALKLQGTAEMHNNIHESAHNTLSEALQLAEKTNQNNSVKTDLLLLLAANATFHDKKDVAAQFYKEAYRIGKKYFEANDWGLLGISFIDAGDLIKAKECIDSVRILQNTYSDTILYYYISKKYDIINKDYITALALSDSIQKYSNKSTENKLKFNLLHQEKLLQQQEIVYYRNIAEKEKIINWLILCIGIMALLTVIISVSFYLRKQALKIKLQKKEIEMDKSQINEFISDSEKKDNLISDLIHSTSIVNEEYEKVKKNNDRLQNDLKIKDLEIQSKVDEANKLKTINETLKEHYINEQQRLNNENNMIKYELGQFAYTLQNMEASVKDAKAAIVKSYRASNDSSSHAIITKLISKGGYNNSEISKLINELITEYADNKSIARIERIVNETMENVLSLIINEFRPDQRERLIITLSLAGYNYKFIAYSLGMKSSTLSSLKSRLINKILSSSSINGPLYRKYLYDQTYNK